MDLGAFSVSLAVRDLAASQEFYAKLGFERVGGEPEQNWLILRHGDATIGLFQGMFEANILTFNPSDVRAVQKRLKESGLTFHREADPSGSGPGHAVLSDPDGNTILLDQF